MHGLLRQSFISSIALYLVAAVYPGLLLPASLLQLLLTGLIFCLLDHLVKPLVKVILLPFNLLTLGLLSWVAPVLVIMIAVKFIPGLAVLPASLPAWQSAGFAVPSFHLNLLASFIVVSLGFSLAYKLIDWILWQD